MYLEQLSEMSAARQALVSISFGDLMYLEHSTKTDTASTATSFNLLWRSNVFGTSESFITLFIEFVSISFGDLMYLEPKFDTSYASPELVSISFGDLMYLEHRICVVVRSRLRSFQSPLEI